MPSPDKFTAVWLSHSSIGDYLNCPRLYYLRNVYKDPKTGHKITVMSPPLALGQAVHDTIQKLATLPSDKRFELPLLKNFKENWQKVSSKKGGFRSKEEEKQYYDRGVEMIKRVIKNPEPLQKKAIPAKTDLPYYWLSEEDNIILCGKIDWLQYNDEDDSVNIIDFKTGKRDEDQDSLQLPIYNLLASNTQERKVAGASYWYLDREDTPTKVNLPNLEEAHARVYDIAKRIALARKLDRFLCPNPTTCRHCFALEQVFKGGGELVGISDYNQDIYIV